ncbi:pre-rrna-processing protein esf2 [Diplodia corticola]|uniref:ATPase synthesis protein 25 n=1 Tax=Diplodia corticola TaxID=236234 RepID=A0A1J9R014_9PEZI|nr:pre-rrna-processing protein esf2 [Diplodia corticola]OJD34694.1 pre-rrna-processing protein esf2 [Diplodia corticola]
MAASRVIASGIRCGACRTRFSRSIVSLAGLDSSAAARPSARATTRPFTTAPLRLSDDHTRKEPHLDDAESAPATTSPSADPQAASVPWYLQVDAPQQPLDASAHPLADRHRIPALPDHPPEILEGFLQYVSVDLGIDDLSLLDCRHLDPPAALGANLLMLFGTARSEKHLHVSADRLCRWLRTEYKLSPHADGLLGRNELKLKLRRKARKARMLSNAGVPESSLAADDGIRTGWICVNVGSVKAAESTPKADTEIKGFVGFGGKSKGVSIVLQLFTEEKRAELDLEHLWNGVLKTDRRRKEMSTPDDELTQRMDKAHNPNGVVLADTSVAESSNPFQHTDPRAPLQTRAFHTTRAKANGTRMAFERAGNHSLANNGLRPRGVPMSTISDSRNSPFNDETSLKIRYGARPDEYGDAIALAKRLELLRQMPTEEKLKALGTGDCLQANNSTPFLKGFYECVPENPGVVHYEAIMQLYLIARSVDHPSYSVFFIQNLLREMQVAGIRVPEHMFLASLRTFLSSEHPGEKYEDSARRRYQIVFSILYAMQGHSYAFLTDEIILMLHKSVSTPPSDLKAQLQDPVNVERRKEYNSSVRHELLHQIDMLDIPLKRQTFADLLTNHAMLGDMDGMWHVWSSTALAMYSRSAYMYAVALNGVAFTGNQKDCIKAVRDCVITMGQEVPPVELEGDVRDALMRCLLVIEPDIDTSWERGGRKGEWLSLWDRCMRDLQDERAKQKAAPKRPVPKGGVLKSSMSNVDYQEDTSIAHPLPKLRWWKVMKYSRSISMLGLLIDNQIVSPAIFYAASSPPKRLPALHQDSPIMSARKRNEWLETDDASDDEDAGYNSEAEEQGRSRATALAGRASKRRKVDESDDESADDDDDNDGFDPSLLRKADARSVPKPAGLAAEEDNAPEEEEADAAAAAADDDDDGNDDPLEPAAAAKRPLSAKKLEKAQKAVKKTGVVYLSRIPPFMKPATVKSLLSQHGAVGRVFLTPEDPAAYRRRKQGGGNKKKSYVDGWVEFVDKRDAKACVGLLNAKIVGGKKGGYYYDDVWNMRYLTGFKWHHLTEQIANENAERASKMRAEISRSTRENKEFIQNVERAKMLEGMAAKKKSKSAGKQGVAAPVPDGKDVRRQFKQAEVKSKKTKDVPEQPAEVKRVLSKIF